MYANHVRCLNPSCGAREVEERRVRINAETSRTYPLWPFNLGLGACIACAGAALVLIGAHGDKLTIAVWACAGGLGAAVLTVASRRIAAISGHHYTCGVCGQVWQWREDRPYPQGPDAYSPSSYLTSRADLLRMREEEAVVPLWIRHRIPLYHGR